MEKHFTLQTSQPNTQLGIDVGFEAPNYPNKNESLSPKETRKIVTPYAFFVADELLGTPLAGPFRRGFALLIDLFFLALLTQVSSLVLAAVAAWTFFRAGNRLQTKKRFNAVRICLRLLVTLLLFVVAMGILDAINDSSYSDDSASGNSSPDNSALDYESPNAAVTADNPVSGIALMALTAKYLLDTKAMKQQVVQGECEPAYNCLQTLGEELVQDLVNMKLDRDTIDGALEGYLASVSENLNAEQHSELTQQLQQFIETKQISKSNVVQKPIEANYELLENDKPYTETSGFVHWFENLVEELGIGFGWAAFYFSVFTAWWKGQTPGKKLMGMKVIKLDNKPLNLWESFGRYGGYAAGFATGLTGFLQVFWDPNRQAIQDKISETLVIDLRKPKVPFVKQMLK
jgi:hypothetical protein